MDDDARRGSAGRTRSSSVDPKLPRALLLRATRRSRPTRLGGETPRVGVLAMGITHPTPSDAASATTSRAFRTAGWIITGMGVILLVLVIGYAVAAIQIVAGNPGSHEASDPGCPGRH